MSCSECRGFRVSVCPCCLRGGELLDHPDYDAGIELFESIRLGVQRGEITHEDEIQDKLGRFAKDHSYDDHETDSFNDYAWEELNEYKGMGEDWQPV